jgi:6-phosphogluconolactonase
LLVSGGNSPVEIFSHLNQMLIPWSKVTIILGDDRMLDIDSSDSNDKLIRENLIINNAGSAKYLSLIDPSVTPSKLIFPFDVSLLGMGLDGHFASLFPELLANTSLFEVDAPHEIYLSKNALGDPSHKRITMNLSMLLNSVRCILLVSSESKRGVLDQAIGDSSLPVHHLINQNKIKIEFSDVDF